MNPFSLRETPLLPGTMLLEASAGTGKTYTIEGLYLRLFLQCEISPLEILSVTFTEAATAELRDRIRGRFARALQNLQQELPPDPALDEPDSQTADLWQQKLAQALSVFDEVPIFTIHGFCHRMLREFAFQSGRTFESEVETSSEVLVTQLLDDFFRSHFYQNYPLIEVVCADLLENAPSLIMESRRQRHARVLPEGSGAGDLESWEKELSEIIAEIKTCWEREREDVRRFLIQDNALNKKGGILVSENCSSLLKVLDDYLDGGLFHTRVFEAMQGLSKSELSKSINKRKCKIDDLNYSILGACEKLIDWMIKVKPLMRRCLVEYVNERYPSLKRRLNVLTYDDMLTDLYDALRSESGELLAQAIRGRYKAALIDEFQDTDSLQWEIFRTLFCVPGHRLFLIGDPKQAIYSFRGADVYTYLGAARVAQSRYTLDKNFRSEARLVEACNLLFRQQTDPFCNSRITYEEVMDAERESGMPTFKPGEEFHPAPMQLRCCGEGDERMTKEELEKIVVRSVCEEIVRLLSGGARIGDRPVLPSDIAVLVRKKSEGKKIQKALLECGLNAVLQLDENVFFSEEAGMLSTFMAAVLEPGNESRVRSALILPIFGYTIEEFFQVTRGDESWSSWMETFAEWNAQWQQHGFLYVFRSMLNKTGGRERLLSRPGGERAVTNWMHLAEILHKQEQLQKLSPESLFSWFIHQHKGQPGAGSPEYEIRMESERSAIQVVTIHKSKGLAYGIVFCPFCWSSQNPKEKPPFLLHDDEDGSILFNGSKSELEALSFGDENGFERYKREEKGSEIRILYVALTRARHRCYLYGLPPAARGYSPLDTMLGRSFQIVFPELAENHPEIFGLENLNPELGAPCPRYEQGDRSDPNTLQVREFRGTIQREGMLTSFSSLLRGWDSDEPERQDPGTGAEDEEDPEAVDMVYRFPKGIRTGEFFHTVLENIDFAQESSWQEVVGWACHRHGFEGNVWEEAALQIISRTMNTPLPAGGGRQFIRLSMIPADCRQAEVEFHLPVKISQCRQLSDLFREILSEEERREPEPSAKFQFYPVDGYLKGFVDLLFRVDGVYYILDWKTNWLGNHASDYGADRLVKSMNDNGYHLQYHLYTLAVHRFLQQRLTNYDYDRHFGGVYYLFLRGMNPENTEQGIYYRRPTMDSIERIAAYLEGREA